MLKLTLIPTLCAFAAFAQTPAPPNDLLAQTQTFNISGGNSFGPVGITAAFAGPMTTTPGAPYSAQAVTQRVQALADGNRITQTTTNNVARDSKGRVHREESLPPIGNAEPPHLVLIEDPVAGVHITLDSNSKTAIKMESLHMKRADEATARTGIPPLPTSDRFFYTTADGPRSDIQIVSANATKIADEATAKTDLGTQTIEGVVARGTKITRTIPAGDMGNELPLVITTETWFSPELKLLVMSKSSDPRMGETIYKLTNISRAEPDPALFQIPADYTVKDHPGDFMLKIDK